VAKGVTTGIKSALLVFSHCVMQEEFNVLLECPQHKRFCRFLHCHPILIQNTEKGGAYVTTCCTCILIKGKPSFDLQLSFLHILFSASKGMHAADQCATETQAGTCGFTQRCFFHNNTFQFTAQ